MSSVPFTLAPRGEQLAGGREMHIVRTSVVGVASLDGEVLRLQFRAIEEFQRRRDGRYEQGTDESDVRELLIPLRALRTVRVAGPWWRPRMEIAAAELRALDGFPGAAAGEVSLRIRRRDRTDARELASYVEYALASRLLSPLEPG